MHKKQQSINIVIHLTMHMQYKWKIIIWNHYIFQYSFQFDEKITNQENMNTTKYKECGGGGRE